MAMHATLKIDIWTDGRRKLPENLSDLAELFARHAEHVAGLLEECHQSGEIVDDRFAGWWSIEGPEHFQRKRPGFKG